MILNLVCNDNMNFNDGSCCKSSDHRTSLQTITFSVLGAAVLVSVILVTFHLSCRRQNSDRCCIFIKQLKPSQQIMLSVRPDSLVPINP